LLAGLLPPQSIEEQVDVEHYFMSQGIMFPTYIKRYWIGLTANSTRTGSYSFGWTDPSIPAPSTANYIHWGRVLPSNIALEPDNHFTMENCGVANYTERFGGAFGWSDTQCNITAPFMCRTACEWLP
jgi:hypothetical protein